MCGIVGEGSLELYFTACLPAVASCCSAQCDDRLDQPQRALHFEGILDSVPARG